MQTTAEQPARPTGATSRQQAAKERQAAKARARVRALRERASLEIERLIAFLDASDGYTLDEREEAVDDIPCDDNELEFSFSGVTADGANMPRNEFEDEREADDGGREADDEYSLGWTTSGATDGLDMDLEDQHDGREPDVDGEPSLGWTVDGVMDNSDGMDREAGGSYLTEAAQQRYNRDNRYTSSSNRDGKHVDTERGYGRASRRLTNLSDQQRAAVAPRINRDEVRI
jgi:hypothetical protein